MGGKLKIEFTVLYLQQKHFFVDFQHFSIKKILKVYLHLNEVSVNLTDHDTRHGASSPNAPQLETCQGRCRMGLGFESLWKTR